jgi:hypothetical protein
MSIFHVHAFVSNCSLYGTANPSMIIRHLKVNSLTAMSFMVPLPAFRLLYYFINIYSVFTRNIFKLNPIGSRFPLESNLAMHSTGFFIVVTISLYEPFYILYQIYVRFNAAKIEVQPKLHLNF